MDVEALLAAFEQYTGLSTQGASGNGVVGAAASSLLIAYCLTITLTGIPRTVLTLFATPWLAKRLGWRPK